MPGLTDDQLLQAINTYKGAGAPVAPAPAPLAVDPAAVPTITPAPTPTAPPPAPGARDGWTPTALTPDEEAKFKSDMVTKPGYKDWYEEAKKSWGEAPNFDDPNSDYDYRGAWKNGIVPAPYEGDGKYHWGSATDSGQMLKSPDHPTAWMQHFMTATGEDPVVIHGLKTEDQGLSYVQGKYGVSSEQARAILHGKADAPVAAPDASPGAPNTYVPEPAPQNSRQALGQLNAAADTQVQATQQATQAETQANTAEADLLAKQHAEEAAAQAKEAAAHASGVEKVKGLFDQYQSFKSQNANLQAKDSRTTTQRVMGILGKAIGGIADGLSGFSGKQTNFAGDIEKSINDSVDKDIAHQQAAIEGKNKQAAEMLTDLGLARKFFVDDPDAAAAYAKSQRKEMYANSLAELSKRSANPKIQAEGTAAAAKIKQDALQDQAQIYASKENAVYAAQAANSRIQQTADTAYRPGAQSKLILEAKVADKTITPDEMQELNQIMLQEKQIADQRASAGKLSEGQAKAQQLYEASKADATRVEDAMKVGRLPDATDVRLHKSGVVPDSMIADTARVYRSAEAIVNDDLRDESGAQIGDNEKKALLDPLSSTDPEIRKQGYQRIIDKRNALYAKFIGAKKNPPKAAPAKGAPGKGSVPEPKSAATVQFNLGGKIGAIPADQADAFQKKYPSAQRL